MKIETQIQDSYETKVFVEFEITLCTVEFLEFERKLKKLVERYKI